MPVIDDSVKETEVVTCQVIRCIHNRKVDDDNHEGPAGASLGTLNVCSRGRIRLNWQGICKKMSFEGDSPPGGSGNGGEGPANHSLSGGDIMARAPVIE